MRLKSIALLALVVVLMLAIGGSALAVPLVNMPATHAGATVNVINNHPGLLAAVLDVYPGFYAQGYQQRFGTAFPGAIIVYVGWVGKQYTQHVAHEWCHEIMLACDAPGGYGSLSAAWRDFIATSWPQVDTSRWSPATYSHTLMEAIRRAFWYPFYADAEYRLYADRAQITAILQSCGVNP